MAGTAAAQKHLKLNAILESATKRGLYFLSDQDARPPGSAHPLVQFVRRGTDAADEIERVLKVRQRAATKIKRSPSCSIRSALLIEFHSRSEQLPGLEYVLDRLLDATWKSRRRPDYPPSHEMGSSAS